ncbi:hypothetical protein GC087_25785, partial (plasmid) [Pantoea sp. JZ2]
MKQACVDAITQTLGRQPKADELKNIEDRIKEAVRQVSRTNAKNGKGVSLTLRHTSRPQILLPAA